MNVENRKKISIATLNTFGAPFFSNYSQERFQALSEALERMPVDIINLQEVHTYRLLKLLKDKLPSYPYVTYERFLYGAKGGLVTFSREAIEKMSYVSFSRRMRTGNPFTFPSLDIRNKGTLISYIKGAPLAILNTHLTANEEGDWSKQNKLYYTQEQEVEELSRLVRMEAEKKDCVVTTGDFNIPKGSELYEKFVHTSKATDLFKGNTDPTYHSAFLPSGKEAQCIDYIFLYSNSKEVAYDQTSLIFQDKVLLSNGKNAYLSDHIGLSVTIHLNNY